LKFKTKRILIKLILVLFVIMIGFYIAYQIYKVLYPSFKTEIAVRYTAQDGIKCKGIAVRSESVIADTANGYKHYLYNDGEKVAKSSTVAEVYSTSSTSSNALYLQKLEQYADVFDTIARTGSLSGVNMDSVKNQLIQCLSELSSHIESGNYNEVDNRRNDLLIRINSFLNASGSDVDCSNIVSKINSEIEMVKSTNYTPDSYIYSETDGFFSSQSDGYESTINPEILLNMSVSQIEKIISEYKCVNQGCKTITSFEWYLAAVVDGDSAKRFTVGNSVTVDIDHCSEKQIPMTVHDIISDSSSDKSVVILQCNYLNSNVTQLRVEDAMLSFRNYDGVKINRSSLRIEEGETGVYVKYGSKVLFKRVNIIYETEDYVLSDYILSADDEKSDYLCLYDEIIVEGKELYVGKELK